jgi:hypothetical protein
MAACFTASSFTALYFIHCKSAQNSFIKTIFFA